MTADMHACMESCVKPFYVTRSAKSDDVFVPISVFVGVRNLSIDFNCCTKYAHTLVMWNQRQQFWEIDVMSTLTKLHLWWFIEVSTVVDSCNIHTVQYWKVAHKKQPESWRIKAMMNTQLKTYNNLKGRKSAKSQNVISSHKCETSNTPWVDMDFCHDSLQNLSLLQPPGNALVCE